MAAKKKGQDGIELTPRSSGRGGSPSGSSSSVTQDLEEANKKKRQQEQQAAHMGVATGKPPNPDELSKEENQQIEQIAVKDINEQLDKIRHAYSEHGEDWISKIMANMSNMMRANMLSGQLNLKLKNVEYILENKNKSAALTKDIAELDKKINGQPPPSQVELTKLEEKKANLQQQKQECIKNIKGRLEEINDSRLRKVKNGGEAKGYLLAKERENFHAKLSTTETLQSVLHRSVYAAATTAKFAGYEAPKAMVKCTFAAVAGAIISPFYLATYLASGTKTGQAAHEYTSWAAKSVLNAARGAVDKAVQYFADNPGAAMTDWWKKGSTRINQEREEEKKAARPRSQS